MPNPMPLLLIGAGALLLMSKKGKGTTHVEEDAETAGEPPGPGPLDEIPGPARSGSEQAGESLVEKCDRFIEEIWVDSDDEDELPINAVAVEESILPALHTHIGEAADQKGSAISSSDVVTGAVTAAMEAVAPGCGWEVVEGGWRYAGGQPVEGKVHDVLLGVISLVPKVTGDINVEKGYLKKAGLSSKKTGVGLSSGVAKGGGGGIGNIGG